MKVVTKYPSGIFSWIDLATTDVAGAKGFYGALFGWEAIQLPTDMDSDYILFQIDGKNVAGMSELSQEMQEQGVPPVWSSYVNHEDVDAVASRVKAAGGGLMMEPMDVMDSGRMVFATDPSGAAFGVWQPKNHIGADLVNMPNTLVWNELQTRDVEGAKAFYNAVFGWEFDTDPNGYVMFKQNGRVQAGMIQMDDSWPAEVPPNWGIYIMVEDVDAKVAQVKELGGQVHVPPTPAGEIGRFSLMQDPQGATFTVITFNGPVDAPPGH